MSDNQKPPSATVGFQVFFLYAFLLATLSPEALEEIGKLISLGIIALVALILKLLDEILAAFEMPYQARSGMWLAVTLGPYLGIVTLDRWQFALFSAFAGLFGAIVGFVVGYYSQSLIRFAKNCVQAIAVHERWARFIVRFLGIAFVTLFASLLIYIIWVGGQYFFMADWVGLNSFVPVFFFIIIVGSLLITTGIGLWQFSESGRHLAVVILLLVSVGTFAFLVTARTVLEGVFTVLLEIFCGLVLVYLSHPTVKSLFK